MNNFITLLDTTLHLNKEDDKSEDETDGKKKDDHNIAILEEEEEEEIPETPAVDIHRSSSLPSKSLNMSLS